MTALADRPITAWEASGQGPMTGMRVLDLSRFIAGPLCAQILGDLGADVVKVERIGGEDARRNAPRYHGKSLYTTLLNRNKRGVCLDPRASAGRAILRRLAARADVIVENFRPGTLARMGIGLDDLAELNPRAVVVSISGFGPDVAERDRPLFDCVAQAASGLMHLNAQPGGPPLLTKIFPADSLAAAHAVIGTLAALLHRERGGEAQHVDVSVFDALFSAMGTAMPAYLVTGELPPRGGNRDDYNAPANLFPTVDGHVYLHAGTPNFWARFCTDVLRRPEVADDPRFATTESRMRHQVEIEALVSAWTSERSGAEVEAAFAAAGIPCAEVADVPAAADREHVWQRDMLLRTADTDGDELVLVGNPVKLSATPPLLRLAPPHAGEHTDEVLRELGVTPDEIATLHADGVV